MKTDRIELGDLVRDTVTKFEGVVIGDTQWLHGCRRLTVQPRELDKDGKQRESQGFDEHQLVLVKKGVVPVTSPRVQEMPRAARTGGPSLGREPTQRRDAERRR